MTLKDDKLLEMVLTLILVNRNYMFSPHTAYCKDSFILVGVSLKDSRSIPFSLNKNVIKQGSITG